MQVYQQVRLHGDRNCVSQHFVHQRIISHFRVILLCYCLYEHYKRVVFMYDLFCIKFSLLLFRTVFVFALVANEIIINYLQ